MPLRTAFIVLIGGVFGSVGLTPVGALGSASDTTRVAAPATEGQSLVRNGGFEDPMVTRTWMPFFASGERRIPGWRVVRHSVDV